MEQKIEIFCCSASEDQKFLYTLKANLMLLQRQELVTICADRDIFLGREPKEEIEKHLDTADIILLLISSDFIASEYYDIEVQRALERHRLGSARVIPILLRPADWELAPFASLQVLPKDKKAVTTWKNEDLAYMEIAIEIRKLVEVLRRSPGARIRIYTDISEALKDLNSYQQKVSELKSVHNMLSEIERLMEGLIVTIQIPLLMELMDKNKGKKSSLGWPFIRKEVSQFPGDIIAVENLWWEVLQKINDLAYFAAEEMVSLGERLVFKSSGAVRGTPWIKELLEAQSVFEESMRPPNAEEMDKSARELLKKCRKHLYEIDQQLLRAVKEVDSVLRSIQ